jgi:acetolactate synthase-1/2/3 large subunit
MFSNLPDTASARRLVDALVNRGIDTFFGIPGGPICPLFEAIRLNPKARLIESRHESHAVFAASLYYRASGKIPVVVVTAGPGMTNAVTGVASASLERIPMLVISGDVPWAFKGECLAQDSGPEGVYTEAIYAPITRGRYRASRPESVVTQALAALNCAGNSMNPGPALFVLPLNHAMAPCEDTPISESYVLPQFPSPSQEVVDKTVELLKNAKRPLIVIGAGCRGIEGELAVFLHTTNIPFVTTPRGKGLVDETLPGSLRNGGMAASIWARKYTRESVDVCLSLGTDLDDTSMGPTKYVGPNGKLIHVDLDPRVFSRNVPTEMGVVAHVGNFVRHLSHHWVKNSNVQVILDEIKGESAFDFVDHQEDSYFPIRPHRILADLEAAAPADAQFVTDIGEHMLFALHYLTAKPGNFFIQLNLGSMASGVAGAIGLAVADPTRPVICIAGDGCMQMAGMEALLALKEKLPILFVVFNDGRYNMVHHGMRQIFGEASTYEMPPVDFTVWAQSMGLPNALVTNPGEVTKELVSNLLQNGPALLDVRIDASIRIRGGGRVEALQHMSMLSKAQGTPV